MKKAFNPYLILAFFVLVFTPLGSACAEEGSWNFSLRQWAVGQTATYQVTVFKNHQLLHSYTETYSIVGQETVKGKNYFWLEDELVGDSGGIIEENHVRKKITHLILKFQDRAFNEIDFKKFLPYFPGLLASSGRRLIGQTQDGPVDETKLSLSFVSAMENSRDFSEWKDSSGDYTHLPEESVTVNAGIFKSSMLRSERKNEAWAGDKRFSQAWREGSTVTETYGSPKIPITGIIQRTETYVSPAGQPGKKQMELLSYSDTGAVAKITDIPPDPYLNLPTPTNPKTTKGGH